MAITTPLIASFTDCFTEVVKGLGVTDLNRPDGTVVAVGSPYSENDIKKRLLDADYEIRILICESQDNPFRDLYFKTAETTDWLTNNSLIPAGVAAHSIGYIKSTSGALDNTKTKARLAKNLYEVEKVQSAFALFGSPVDLFYIHSRRIYLAKADAVIQFDCPKLLQVANTLYVPLAYKWAVIALAITKSFMPGTNENHRGYWTGVWRQYEARIQGRTMDLPEPEQLKRIGA